MMSQFAISNFASAATLKISDNLKNEETNILEKQTKLLENTISINNSSLDENKTTIINGSELTKRKNHNCPYCDRSFTRPYRLNDHISFSHTDEKKYLCVTCSKNFSCKDKLKHHIDVKHDNKKSNLKSKAKIKNTEELKCNFPGCSKAFANKYNVKRHIENVHLKLRRKVTKLQSKDDNEYNENNTFDDNGSNIMNNSDHLDVSTRSESGINSLHCDGNFKIDDNKDINKDNQSCNSDENDNRNNKSNKNNNIKNDNNDDNNNSNSKTNNNNNISDNNNNNNNNNNNSELNKIILKNKGVKMKNYDSNYDGIINQSDASKIINVVVNNSVSSVVNSLPTKIEHELIESRLHLKNINQSYRQHQQTEGADDGKNSKIYTCAKCPEMFSSSNLLRKHVSEHHEKGFLLYNLW